MPGAKRWSQKSFRAVADAEAVAEALESEAVSEEVEDVDGTLAMDVTSAPAEKNRPAPVRTVIVVAGWVSKSCRAEMVSSIMEPPKELRAWGRLNYKGGGG